MTGSSRMNTKEESRVGEKNSIQISYRNQLRLSHYNKTQPHILVVEGNPKKSITLLFNFRKGNSEKDDIITKEKLQIQINNPQDVLKLFKNILKPGVNIGLGKKKRKEKKRVSLKKSFITNW